MPRAWYFPTIAACRQVLHIALVIPLALLYFRRLFQGDDTCATRVQVFHEALDGATLAGRIAPFEEDDHALAGLFDPGLQLEQFALQVVFLPLVILARHQVPVGVSPIAPLG